MPVEGFIRNIVRAICICAGVSLLVACDSSTSRSASVVTRSTEYVISGAAVNGPLAFAEVSVYAPDGRLLGYFSKRKNDQGLFIKSLKNWQSLKISNHVGESLRWAPLPPAPTHEVATDKPVAGSP